MERDVALDSSRKMYRRLKSNGLRKPRVSEVIQEPEDPRIHSQEHWIEPWTEQFKEQFS